MRFRALVTIVLLLGLTPLAVSAEKIVFGFYPSHNREQLTILANEFCTYLSEETDFEVEPLVSVDYETLVDAITNDELQFAWMSPLSFVRAEKKGNARVLLKSVRGTNPFYWGSIVVRKDRSLDSVHDLEGKKMGWTYPSSTAGYIFTKAGLEVAGIDSDRFFSENLFLGGYDELVKAVLDGTVDGGACFANNTKGTRGAWTQYLPESDGNKLTPIFYTKAIPGDTITGSKKYIAANPKVSSGIVRALLEMGDSEAGRKILGDLYQVDYLVDAEKEDYNSVREAAEIFPNRN